VDVVQRKVKAKKILERKKIKRNKDIKKVAEPLFL